MGGFLATLDDNNKVVSIMKQDAFNKNNSQPAVDTSELVSLYNKGFIKLVIDINLIKNYITKIWNRVGIDESDISGNSNNFIFKSMNSIVDGNFKVDSLLLPIMIGSNYGLYSLIKQTGPNDPITIIFPNIIFSEYYNTYFNTFLKINKMEDNNFKMQEVVIKLLGTINTNNNIINNEIKFYNIINLLLRISFVAQFHTLKLPIEKQENITNLYIEEIVNIINLIPSDKCYSDIGIIKSDPNICTDSSSVPAPMSSSAPAPMSSSVQVPVSVPVPVPVPESTTTESSSSIVNPLTISCCCCCCLIILFIFLLINFFSKNKQSNE